MIIELHPGRDDQANSEHSTRDEERRSDVTIGAKNLESLEDIVFIDVLVDHSGNHQATIPVLGKSPIWFITSSASGLLGGAILI